MAFPSDSGTLKFGLAEAWEGIRRCATQVKQFTQSIHDSSVAGPITSRSIINYVVFLADKRAEIVLLAQTITAQGYLTERTFETASLATFRTQLQGLIATID